MLKYIDKNPANLNKALLHYQINIKLSESFYSLLSIFEVALRNSLNRELTSLYGTQDWYLHVGSVPGLKDLRREINMAQNHITKRKEIVKGSKIVDELTLGFWVRILNV